MRHPFTSTGRVSRFRSTLRGLVVVIVVLHGLLHLLGAAKGLGWSEVDQLREPISSVMGLAWLAGAAVVVGAGLTLAVPSRWWWVLGGSAAVASQTLIDSSWSDAKAGTVANVILLTAAAHEFAARGPHSIREEYRHHAAAALTERSTPDLVTDADLDHLPAAVATYIRRSGAVGQPRVHNFRARTHGRIRSAPDKPWMTFVGEQVNTYSPHARRLFFMDATMFGLPVDVLHVFEGSASMRVKLCSLKTMVESHGEELDAAETVTLFNDMCVYAPAALIGAPVTWQVLDHHRVRGWYTKRTHTVAADLVFDDDGDLVDFVSDDRLRATADGTSYTRTRWSTPIAHYLTIGNRRIATFGEARWHGPPPEGEFVYFESHLDELTCNVDTVTTNADPTRHRTLTTTG